MLRCQVSGKLIYRFNTVLTKILAAFLIEIDEIILKFIWKCKDHTIAKSVLKEEQIWRNFTIWFQNLSWIHGNDKSVFIGVKINTEIIRIEHRSVNQNRSFTNRLIYIFMDNWFLSSISRSFRGERTIFSISGTWTAICGKRNFTLILYHVLK